MRDIVVGNYAMGRFLERSRLLGQEGSAEELRQLLSMAVPEMRPKNRATRLHFLKRKMLRGNARYLVAEGWRFVVRHGRLVTCERIKPHENYEREGRRTDYAKEDRAVRKAA